MKNMERQSFLLCLLTCLFPSSRTRTGIVLPPQNVSPQWLDGFTPGLSWSPPLQWGDNCSYVVTAATTDSPDSPATDELPTSPASFPLLAMEGGSILWTITRVCDGSASKPVVFEVSYPELVKNLQCFLYSPDNARCQWSPNTPPADFRFYYKLVDECNPAPSALRECPSYILADGVRSGCELKATRCHVAYVLVNGTVNDAPVRNTFERQLQDDVRLGRLEWDVTKSGNKFNVSWKRPEITVTDGWTIQINYTECGATHQPLDVEGEATSQLLVLDPHCPHAVAVRATSRSGATPWSRWRHFDGEADALLYVVVAVPLLIAALVVLACVCLRRCGPMIFPEVPKPSVDLSEIDNDNNNCQGVFQDLYISAKEEECKISLVVDPERPGDPRRATR